MTCIHQIYFFIRLFNPHKLGVVRKYLFYYKILISQNQTFRKNGVNRKKTIFCVSEHSASFSPLIKIGQGTAGVDLPPPSVCKFVKKNYGHF